MYKLLILNKLSSTMETMKKSVALFLFALLLGSIACAEDEINLDPEEKARRAHELSASDVIYQQEDFKALYYQNQRIIELLKEMRDELHNLNMRQAKETQS